MRYTGLTFTQDVYNDGPKEPSKKKGAAPVIQTAPPATVVRSTDLYVKADHWVGMRSSLTNCLCLCHRADGMGEQCDDMPGRPDPNWCNASPHS